MAISNYSELKTAIASWLKRSDLTDNIPDFIAMAESRLNRMLSLRTAEIDVALTVTPGSRFAALPTDFVDAIALWIDDGSGKDQLALTLPQTIYQGPDNSRPTQWCIDGANVRFDYPLDQAYATTLRYTQSFELSDTAPTNWLLTNHPDLYLYASLLESATFIMGDQRLPVWQDRYDRAYKEVDEKEARSRTAPLQCDLGMTARVFPYSDGRFW